MIGCVVIHGFLLMIVFLFHLLVARDHLNTGYFSSVFTVLYILDTVCQAWLE